MKPANLSILQQADKEFYDAKGYLCMPGFVPEIQLQALRTAVAQLVENSRQIAAADGVYDLEDGHGPGNPRLRRVAFLDDIDPVFWNFAANSVVTDMAADLLGPDLTFRECLINFKWSGGGQAIKWHQDIPFYPHTNLSSAQFLVFIEAVTHEQGPLQVVPGSHKDTVYDHYGEDESWLGYIRQELLENIPLETAEELTDPAGTVTAHHCATVHGSRPNLSSSPRPALILGYNAEDARPYTAPAYPSSHYGQVVRGRPARYARHDNISLRLPPDWSGGYTSIFTHQQESGRNE